MSASEAFAVGAGADFDAVFFAGAGLPLAVEFEAGAAAGAGAGVDLAAGAGADAGVEDAGVDDALAAGVEDDALALAFLLFREEVFAEEASAGAAAAALPDAAASALDDFLAESVPLEALELSAAAPADFFDFLEDFFVELSAGAVESPDADASAFFELLEDFLVVEESVFAAGLSLVPASAVLLFFDFDDFAVVDLSADAELSLASALAFLDFFFFAAVEL